MTACPWASPPVRLALVIGVSGSSSSADLPTLTVKGNYNRAGASSKSGDGLITALLPTLTASTASRGKHCRGPNAEDGPSLTEALLPTLTASRYGSNGDPRTGLKRRPSLAALLPTLAARDWKTGKASQATHDRWQARPLSETVVKDSPPASGSLLDPRWCEECMGFPAGWTDPGALPDGPPPVYVKRASGRSETASCPPAPKSLGGGS